MLAWRTNASISLMSKNRYYKSMLQRDLNDSNRHMWMFKSRSSEILFTSIFTKSKLKRRERNLMVAIDGGPYDETSTVSFVRSILLKVVHRHPYTIGT